MGGCSKPSWGAINYGRLSDPPRDTHRLAIIDKTYTKKCEILNVANHIVLWCTLWTIESYGVTTLNTIRKCWGNPPYEIILLSLTYT